MSTTIWSISDTHCYHDYIKKPDEHIDLFIYAGDSTNSKHQIYNDIEFLSFFKWLVNLDVEHKVIIAGNHDCWALDPYNKDKLRDHNIHYLENSGCVIRGLNIWGSPYTPHFCDWYFDYKEDYQAENIWDLIPNNTDILVTHGPAYDTLDAVYEGKKVKHVGCPYLVSRIATLETIKLHLFGHIHNSRNLKNHAAIKFDSYTTTYANVSCMTDYTFPFKILNQGMIFKL